MKMVMQNLENSYYSIFWKNTTRKIFFQVYIYIYIYSWGGGFKPCISPLKILRSVNQLN